MLDNYLDRLPGKIRKVINNFSPEWQEFIIYAYNNPYATLEEVRLNGGVPERIVKTKEKIKFGKFRNKKIEFSEMMEIKDGG